MKAYEEIIQDEANILAYASNGEYLTNQTVGGTGYLRLIIPPKNDSDLIDYNHYF